MPADNTPDTPPNQPTKKQLQQSARERLAAERARQRQRQARQRRLGVVAAVVAVLVVAAGVIVAVNLGGSSDKAAGGKLVVPANATGTDGTVIVYGNPNAAHTLDVWEDFRCPICRKLETTDGKTIQQLADNGTYKIQYHMATFLDGNLGGNGSMHALEVAGAALNEGVDKFKAFHDVLYANQPDEQTDGFSNFNTLLDLAAKVPGLKTAAFTKAVQDRTYAPWAAKVSAAFNSSGVTGTPTLELDGKQLTVFDTNGTPLTSAQYTALIQQTIGAK